MSEYFSGVTFEAQRVTPSDDGQLHRAILPDCILSGCAFSYSGASLSMGAGSLMICGRQIRHTATQSWPMAGAASGYARLVLTIDLSETATEDTFEQVSTAVEYAAETNGFAPLIQADVNAGGTRYQKALCVVSLSGSGITGIVDRLPQPGELGAYAPDGFGLGKFFGKTETSFGSLANLRKTGWYQLKDAEGKAFICGIDFSRSVVYVESYDVDSLFQTLSKVGSQTKARRHLSNGFWSPWAIENPPMELGVEYLTTELWENTPVYTTRIAVPASSLTAQNVSVPHGIIGLGICLSAHAIWKRTDEASDGWRQLPSSDYSTGEWDGHVEYVNGERIQFRLGSKLQYRMKLSAEPVYVTLKYTKL